MMALTFTVYGVPQQQGSARAYTYRRKTGGMGARVDHDNPKVKTWRQTVGLGAIAARGAGVLPARCAIELDMAFYLPRPQRPKSPHCITRPDLDKFIRAIGDALTGICFLDDAQIVKIAALKAYTARGEAPRAVITVRPAETGLFDTLHPQREAIQ